MPEWTGKTRDKAYALLNEGKLQETCALIGTFPKFKQSDMKPVDAEAMGSFAKKVEADDRLQELLCHAAQDDSDSIRRLAVFLLGYVKVDGKHFAACLDRLMPEAKNHVDKLVGLNKYYADKKKRQLIHSLIDAICTSASPEGMALLTRPPKDSGLRRKYEHAHEALKKLKAEPDAPRFATKKTNAAAAGNSIRDELIGMLSQGDPDKVEAFIKKLPKMTAAQVRTLCENLPAEAAAGVTKNQKIRDKAFDWMQDAGTFGQVAAEWVRQGDWEKLREPLIDWIGQLFVKSETWERDNKDGYYLKSKKKIPRVNQYVDVLAANMDAHVIAAYTDYYEFGKHNPYANKKYMQQEIAAALVRQIGSDAARQRLQALSEPPPGVDKKVAAEYPPTVARMLETIEQKASAGDPIEAISYAGQAGACLPEERERRFNLFMADNGRGGPPMFPRAFIEDERYAKETIPCLALWMQEDGPEYVDAAFRLLMINPPLAAELGCDLLELTARGLWHMKSAEVNKAIVRIQALAKRGVCKPAEAAGRIEQTFSSEEPSTWRAAAEAIQYLRKIDSKIALSTTDRIAEIISRDPVKYGKFLSALLGDRKIKSKK